MQTKKLPWYVILGAETINEHGVSNSVGCSGQKAGFNKQLLASEFVENW